MILDLCKSKQHEFTEENTYVTPSTGKRICRACRREATKYWMQQQDLIRIANGQCRYATHRTRLKRLRERQKRT